MRKVLLFTLVVISISSCKMFQKSKSPEMFFTASGFPYQMIQESTDSTKEPQVGDEVYIRYKVLMEDSVIYERFYSSNPEIYKLGFGRGREAVEEAIKVLDKGDVARFKMKFSDVKSRTVRGLNDTVNVDLLLALDSVKYNQQLYPIDVTGMDTVTTESGLQYVILEEGTGGQVKVGDEVTAHYTGFLENGDIFDSSVDRGQPLEMPIGVGRLIKGWDEAFPLFKVGTKAKLIIPSHLGYGNRNYGRIVGGSTLIFDIEVIDTKEPVVKEPGDEVELIEAVPFDVKGKVVQQLDNGLQIIIVEHGEGKKASVGNRLSVHYTGYLMDGTKFSSSVESGQPIEFVLGTGKVINGWDIAFTHLREGDKAQLIIPAKLAYGERQKGRHIKPNSDLKFDVELLKVYR